MRRKFILAMATIVIAVTAFSCREEAIPQEQKSYKTLNVTKGNTSVSTLYTASIRGEQFVDIRPQVSGVITNIAINEGATLKKGQTLFVIDQTPYQTAVDIAVANVAIAEANVATAKLNAESGESLYKDKVISNIELQTLKNTLLSAESALKLAQAEEKSARNELSYTVVKSPVDGVAGMINYRKGALVSSSIDNPLVSVSSNETMYAYFSISESALLTLIQSSGSTESLIKDMDDVTLILNNGSAYVHKGEVDIISGIIDSSTGSVGLRAKFQNPELMLRDGGNGSLSIATAYEDVIVVPKVATYEIQNKTFVYKVIDGKAKSAEITVMNVDNGSEFIVKSGLDVGDVIIAEGAGLMREGTIITENKE
ncbi:MAG: efflux RND transporter periplasmic adaptor subunit [Rikenellaceae bacterium]